MGRRRPPEHQRSLGDDQLVSNAVPLSYPYFYAYMPCTLLWGLGKQPRAVLAYVQPGYC